MKTLATLIVTINNIYSVDLLEFRVSNVNPTSIFINQLPITENSLMSDIYNIYEWVRTHALTYDCRMCAHVHWNVYWRAFFLLRQTKYEHYYCMHVYICTYLNIILRTYAGTLSVQSWNHEKQEIVTQWYYSLFIRYIHLKNSCLF